MTVIVSMLLYMFGLNATTGKLNYSCEKPNNKQLKNVTIDGSGNIVIYDPYYNPKKYPVYYNSPYIIIPNPASYTNIPRTIPQLQENTDDVYSTYGSSSPAYQN